MFVLASLAAVFFAIQVHGAGPVLARITPSSGVQNAYVPVTLTGTGFVTGTSIGINSSTGITILSPKIVNSTTMTAVLVVDFTAPPTPRNVAVSPSGSVSNTVVFTVNALSLPSPGPAPIPTPTSRIILDSFTSLRVINPNETDPLYRNLWSAYPQCSNQGAQCRADISAADGALTAHITLNNLYLQF
jgi:hypothetical protein